MPTYQYACTSGDCGNRFELVQSFTDPAASECPACGGPVRKVFSAVGVVFKGSGFYRTDSRSNGKTKADSSPAAKESSSPDKSSSAADSSAAGSSTSGSGAAKSKESSTTGSGGSTGKVAASA